MDNGSALHRHGSKGDSATNLNGYRIIQAKNVNAVKSLLRDHPYQTPDSHMFTVEIFELPG